MSKPSADTSSTTFTDCYFVATQNYAYRITKNGDRWHLRAVCAHSAFTVVDDMFVDWLEEIRIGAGVPVNWPGFPPAHYDPDDPVRWIMRRKPDETSEKLTSFRLD